MLQTVRFTRKNSMKPLSRRWKTECGTIWKIDKLLWNALNGNEQMQSQISDIAHQAVLPVSNIILYTQLLEENLSGGIIGDDCNETDDKVITKTEAAEFISEIAAIRDEIGTLDF